MHQGTVGVELGQPAVRCIGIPARLLLIERIRRVTALAQRGTFSYAHAITLCCLVLSGGREASTCYEICASNSPRRDIAHSNSGSRWLFCSGM